MRVVPNWRAVLTRAWSVRFWVLAAIFTGLEVALPFTYGVLPVPPTVFAALSGICAALGLLSRFIVQKNVSGGPDA